MTLGLSKLWSDYMARKPLRPLIRSGGFYPSRKWTPLVYAGGYTTANGGEEPAPPPIEKTITGNPIHILDALAKPAQALSVKLEPVQDLNGYSYPWPAGGGKNVLPTPTEAQTVNGVTATPNADGSITLTGTASAIAYFDLITGFDSTAYAGYIVTGLPDDMASNSSTICYRISAASSRASLQDIQRGASGTYVSNTIVDNGTNLVFSLRVNNGYALPAGGLTLYPMMRASSASADFSPYSNICPISGWTGAKVTRTGKNLFDGTFIADTMIVDSTGEYYANAYHKCSNKILAKENTVYTLSGTDLHKRSGTATNAANVTIAYYKVDGTYIRREAPDTSTNTYKTVTTPANTAFVIFQVGGQATNVMLEESATETTYEPFGTTYPISWQTEAGTVYGGTLDVTTGNLTVDRAMVDLGAKNWYLATAATAAGRTRFRASITDVERISSPNIVAPMLCSAYKTETANNTYTGKQGISLQQNAADVYVYDAQTESMTTAEFKSAMSGVQLVYKLATPIVYDLTPTQIELFAGENNIWADTGDMTLTYYADGNASDEEALNILLGGRYVNNHDEDEPTDREALNIILGGNER